MKPFYKYTKEKGVQIFRFCIEARNDEIGALCDRNEEIITLSENWISRKKYPVWVEPFNERRLAIRCIISQPATLIGRSAWEMVGGVDPTLHMAMDYDLWWRLYKSVGPLEFIDDFIAVNREHENTKTKTRRRQHYQEAVQVVHKHNGRVPMKWWLAWPYSVLFKAIWN